MRRFRALAGMVCCASWVALAAPVSNTELAEVCAEADDSVQCGRLVEAVQLKRLPNLARREGNALIVSLYPSGNATFTDTDDQANGRSYSLWDYVDAINAVLIYTTAGDTTTFTLLQRTTNRRIELPTEPQVAPDRAHLVTADICEARCGNEVAVWRVMREGVAKELVWSPGATWTDAVAKWKDAATLTFEYVGPDGPGTVEKRLDDPAWKRVR
jgi:hypothetical protein